MKSVTFKTIRAVNEAVKFLDQNISTKLYSVMITDNGVQINITDEGVDILTREDHGCTASPEDGCSYCGHLVDLGLLPEADYDPNDYSDGGDK